MNLKTTPIFDNSYARLPQQFYSCQLPEAVSAPGLIRVNHALAGYLGFDPHWLESAAGVELIAGNYIPTGAQPLATAYAGHQFGGWNPQMGDGRAVLLGEVIATDGKRHDIQLKGSGRTAWSRNGDGRSPLGPVLREYIVSEAMAVLAVPTTRALAAATSGEWVRREERLPGAVLVRVARSHIRIGTFQYFASRQDHGALRALVEHVIQRHYPGAAQAENPVRAMLDGIVARQATLIARWQSLGFVHGVMNTDNILVSGETIDYGPCAFMDAFDAAAVFSSIDQSGRYAYRNQPHIAHWNLSMLAQALLPMLHEDHDQAISTGQAAIDVFPDLYMAAYQQEMRRKLGLTTEQKDDNALIQDLLELMQEHQTDFTLAFRRLSDLADPENSTANHVSSIFEFPAAFNPWLEHWRSRTGSEPQPAKARQLAMYSINPAFIPRNHLLEEAIAAAVSRQDFSDFHALADVLARPFEFDAERQRHALPPRPEQIVRQTFCGT